MWLLYTVLGSLILQVLRRYSSCGTPWYFSEGQLCGVSFIARFVRKEHSFFSEEKTCSAVMMHFLWLKLEGLYCKLHIMSVPSGPCIGALLRKKPCFAILPYFATRVCKRPCNALKVKCVDLTILSENNLFILPKVHSQTAVVLCPLC